jgi:hypothetical protein
MGLPETGKTTYIAALWHVVTSGEVTGSLVISDLQPDREHLNTITKVWRECKRVGRTLLGKDRAVTLNLCSPNGADSLALTLPDSSGEAFKRAFEDRRWSPTVEELVGSTDKILFFVHPSGMVQPERIDALEEIVTSASDAEDQGEESKVGPPQSGVLPWDPKHASPQSKVVDLLQLVLKARPNQPTRIAIVISAWDLVADEGANPESWLSRRAPLLSQFLEAHKLLRPYQIYGVSAQGQDYESHTAELREIVRASDRLKVAVGNQTNRDLTLPIRWLVGW